MSTTPARSRVHRTAHRELELALEGRPRPRGVALGTAEEMEREARLTPAARRTFAAAPAGHDAFHASVHDNTLLLTGNSPRGLLNAVFALRNALEAGAALRDGWACEGTFRIRQRIFHARFQPWPGERADVRAIAQLGASHCLLTHDWQGTRRSLQGYVTSPIFPQAVEPAEVAQNHAGLRRLIDDCADYGLGAMLWLTELPCQGGPWVPAERREHFLTQYPAEVLSDSGTYEGKVLCFSHPRVQDFYRDLLARFFADFPEVETLFIFGLDSGGEFCEPATCPRCRGLSRLQQRDRLIHFLIAEGGKVRPGLRVLTTGWGWDDDTTEFLDRQRALPAASGVYLAAETDGWQCERQSHDFLHDVRRTCRERGQLFIGYDDFHWGDDTVHGLGDIQDFPLGIAAKLRRWHRLEVDGVFDHWGNLGEDIWSNSVACRAFFLDPEADASVVCAEIARRQFGDTAGGAVFQAWEALERAHATLSLACTWPPGQWPGWYAGRTASPVPKPEALEELRRNQLTPRREGATLYNPPALADSLQNVADAWRGASPHYAAAVAALRRALPLADETPVHFHYWWNGSAATPSRRDHIRRQLLYVESMALAGREIGLQFELYALWEKLGRDEASYRRQARDLLAEDLTACREAAPFFTALGKPRKWGELYAEKAERIAAFLAGT